MIKPQKLVNAFKKSGISFFVGVPDSVLSGMISYLNVKASNCIHRSAANEGGAVGLAVGYYISTSKVPLLYMQNSGLGNAINPLTSIVDNKVYGIPMVLLIGARGAFGYKDEPQHLKMGPITTKLLKVLGVKYKILLEKNFSAQIKYAKKTSLRTKQPYALIVKPGLIETTNLKKQSYVQKKLYKRIDFIEHIINFHNRKSFIVASTGFAARELFYLVNRKKKNSNKIFYSIGGMGHANQVAAEYAKQKPKEKIIVIDGDGAVMMHLGNLSTIKKLNLSNFIHIIFNNGVHESTGGQNVSYPEINYKSIFKLFNYKKIFNITSPLELKKILQKKIKGPIGIVIKVKIGTVNNLPRQDIESLVSFKKLIKK